MTSRNGLTAVGIAVCVLTGLAIGLLGIRPANAFADVKEQVSETGSVRYTETRVNGERDSTATHAEMVVTELEHRLAEIEESLETAEGEEQAQLLAEQERFGEMLDAAIRRIQVQGDRPWQTRVMILGRYLKRVEAPNVLGDTISISNAETGESIMIDHAQRSVRRITRQVTIDEETGERNEYEISGDSFVDLYGMFRSVPDDATELADRRIVNGTELIGFRSVEEHGADTWTRTFWVDPETRLPRQIHTEYRSTNPRHGESDWYLSDIEFDVALDESLFSTEPPAGYSVSETSVIGITSGESGN